MGPLKPDRVRCAAGVGASRCSDRKPNRRERHQVSRTPSACLPPLPLVLSVAIRDRCTSCVVAGALYYDVETEHHVRDCLKAQALIVFCQDLNALIANYPRSVKHRDTL